jgi:hypothetical protein
MALVREILMQPVKTIKYTLGSDITLEKLRQIVEQTRDEDGQSKVKINTSRGQRDEDFVEFVITVP